MRDFTKEAKKIVGKWGYEEKCWWKPVADALSIAYQEGWMAGMKERKKNKYQDHMGEQSFMNPDELLD